METDDDAFVGDGSASDADGPSDLRFRLSMNRYPLLLGAGTLACMGGALRAFTTLKGAPAACVVALSGIVGLVMAAQAVTLARTYPYKLRAYRTLCERNADGIRPDTFRRYFRSPCGRVVVREALRTLGYADAYEELKAGSGYRPCRCDALDG